MGMQSTLPGMLPDVEERWVVGTLMEAAVVSLDNDILGTRIPTSVPGTAKLSRVLLRLASSLED